MAKLRLLLFSLIILCVALAALVFLYRNAELITLDFILVRPFDISSGVLALAGFALGGVVGLLVRLPGSIFHHSKSKMQLRALAQKDKEIERLKSESAKAG